MKKLQYAVLLLVCGETVNAGVPPLPVPEERIIHNAPELFLSPVQDDLVRMSIARGYERTMRTALAQLHQRKAELAAAGYPLTAQDKPQEDDDGLRNYIIVRDGWPVMVRMSQAEKDACKESYPTWHRTSGIEMLVAPIRDRTRTRSLDELRKHEEELKTMRHEKWLERRDKEIFKGQPFEPYMLWFQCGTHDHSLPPCFRELAGRVYEPFTGEQLEALVGRCLSSDRVRKKSGAPDDGMSAAQARGGRRPSSHLRTVLNAAALPSLDLDLPRGSAASPVWPRGGSIDEGAHQYPSLNQSPITVGRAWETEDDVFLPDFDTRVAVPARKAGTHIDSTFLQQLEQAAQHVRTTAIALRKEQKRLAEYEQQHNDLALKRLHAKAALVKEQAKKQQTHDRITETDSFQTVEQQRACKHTQSTEGVGGVPCDRKGTPQRIVWKSGSADPTWVDAEDAEQLHQNDPRPHARSPFERLKNVMRRGRLATS